MAALDNTQGDETPSKKKKLANESGEGLAGEKTPKSTRLLLEKTSNIPRPFTLERVIAILRTIHPDGLPRTKGAADKVYVELAELERLRLVVRCTGSYADSGARGGDDGILEEKWRINVGKDFVTGIGRHYGIGLEGWEID
ncbi:hypothetical protein Dsin_032850 [Dipteronia sinensis]|uniref:Origin recognition complex subunit 5 C-terminal domain-containing protein n=1 Tax=Dipteronia sinensis TaxID=43782 RepID=A0AAD9ZEW5_9ROSI|nr:hypothetical protein Dsin_032850 [Dipteronia sinensis]